MAKFNNKYRISSTRLQDWNYGCNGLYFITICTKKWTCFFGTISDGMMELSENGKIVQTEWLKTVEIRPDMNLEMGEYVVMPNHFHGILSIGNNQYNKNCEEVKHRVSSGTMNCFGPQCKNLASIIRGFKIGVTKNARIINPNFSWQPGFNDHIIRTRESYQKISEYIINNPSKWDNDKFNFQKKI